MKITKIIYARRRLLLRFFFLFKLKMKTYFIRYIKKFTLFLSAVGYSDLWIKSDSVQYK